MERIVYNVLIFIDICFNRATYIRQMLDNGFFTADTMTRRQLYRFFRLERRPTTEIDRLFVRGFVVILLVAVACGCVHLFLLPIVASMTFPWTIGLVLSKPRV